jgi:flagellar hook-length control protein FliK
MQISDLMGQYNQGTASGTEKLTGTKGVENLVSSLRSLTKGNIFEGTVSSMKNGRVTLSLSSGQQIMARMDGKVSLSVGQSMFFQVKSNDGSQIAIRPFLMDGTGGNYALMQALSAAGLPAESKYLSMVNRMMEEQMPIDRSSLQQMARTVNLNSEIDVQTLVQLKKLGIPVTPENASQFENYLDDKQAITKELDTFIQQLPTAMQSEEMPTEQLRQMAGEVLSIITEELPDVPEQAALSQNILPMQMQMQENPAGETVTAETTQTAETAQTAQTTQIAEDAQSAENAQSVQTAEDAQPAQSTQPAQTAEDVQSMETAQTAETEQSVELSQTMEMPPATPHTLAAVLEPEQLQNLNQMIGNLLGIENTNYTPQSGTVEVLKDLQQVFSDSLPVEREPIGKLLTSKEFQNLVKDTLEQQWMVEPQEVAEKDQINKLYQRLNSQIERIENAMKASGQNNTDFMQTAADIRSNVEFMNQINQAYTYMQIPLKMSGKNASGELYVYTNKKALAEGNQELTAFLHLDMDNLGPTDVSLRLRGHEVNTNFYLDNDEAYDLIEKNYPVLEERLKNKGYDCKVSVINEAKHVNFVEDFLKKDQPSAGQLHRYSFDMRA